MAENFQKFETIRHSHKQGEDLSELGREMAKEKALEYVEEIKNSPAGTVFYIQSSNVGRAQETKDIIEAELRELCKDEVEFVSVQDVEKVGTIASDTEKKYIITDLAPSYLLGFKKDTPGQQAFVKYKELYNGDEDLVGETWAAQNDELATLSTRVKDKFPHVDVSEIHPKDFEMTPEEIAIRYLRVMERMQEITQKHFPNHPWKSLQVGHNVSADFAAMALLGKDISVATYEELGSKFRDFLESAHFEIAQGKITSTYRKETAKIEMDLNTLISDLETKSEKRKEEWKNME